MKKRSNLLVFSELLIIICLGIITYLLYTSSYKLYMILTITLSVIVTIALIKHLRSTRSKESIYKSRLKSIIKTYDSILVKTKDIPDFTNKEVVRIDYFEDIVSAQEEIKKPLFYIIHEASTSFILIDDSIICVYFLKIDANKKNLVDEAIETAKIKHIYKNLDESLFEDIDNTTIIKFSNNKTYRVSPIKKNNKKGKDNKKEEITEKVDASKNKNRVVKKLNIKNLNSLDVK